MKPSRTASLPENSPSLGLDFGLLPFCVLGATTSAWGPPSRTGSGLFHSFYHFLPFLAFTTNVSIKEVTHFPKGGFLPLANPSVTEPMRTSVDAWGTNTQECKGKSLQGRPANHPAVGLPGASGNWALSLAMASGVLMVPWGQRVQGEGPLQLHKLYHSQHVV